MFGLPDPDCLVAPAGATIRIYGTFSSGMDIERSSIPRAYEQRLVTSFALNDVTCEIDDGELIASVEAANPASGISKALREIRQFIGTLSTLLPPPAATCRVVALFGDDRPLRSTRETHDRPLHTYDLPRLREHIQHAAGLLDGWAPDARLDQALRYFQAGDELFPLTQGDQTAVFAPICFLLYWKALSTIGGDPSHDDDHQNRCKQLGLGRHYFEARVRPLHRLRNSSGVAHIADLQTRAEVTLTDLSRCRETTAEVIGAYLRAPNEVRASWNLFVTPTAVDDHVVLSQIRHRRPQSPNGPT